MSIQENPYAAPVQLENTFSPIGVHVPLATASKGLRLANYFIDYLVQLAISFVIGVSIAIVFGEEGVAMLDGFPDFFLGLLILVAYYFICEATTCRTLGKLITGTKVVDENGDEPTKRQILGRSLCRLIPFEAFSFLGETARGWHDSIPKTRVVKVR